MDGGEKKEEASLPPDYVSLAQLQERWLRKKQEELKLKQKQEEEEKREREARARSERNRNQRGPAKLAGGVLRETGAVQDKGKGKEIVAGSPGNGGDSDNTGRKNGRREERRFKGVAVVEKKEKVGVGAEVLSGGGVDITAGGVGRSGISSRERGESGGWLSVVGVSPRNGVIADAKRADLSGGFRGNGRNRSELALALEKEDEEGGGKKWLDRGRGRNGVKGLKQTEPAVNLGKEDAGENGLRKKWLERDRERGRNGVDELKQSEPKINLKEGGEKGAGAVNEWKQTEPAIGLKKGQEKGLDKKWLETRRERGRYGVNELKESELEINLKEWEGVEKGSGGVNELKQSEPAMNLEESEKNQDNKWKHRGRQRDRNGVNELKQSDPTTDLEKEKEGGNGHRRKWKGKGKGRGRGRNGVDQLNQSEVALDLEKEEEGEKGHGKNWRGSGSGRGRGRNGVNELKQSEVALGLEDEEEGETVDCKKLRGRRSPGGFLERINRLKDMPVVIEGNEVDSELKNKSEDEISEVCSEITSLSIGDANGIPRQDNEAKNDDDDGVEGESSNGLKGAVEIEKKADHEILARKGESWGYEREYPRNGNRRGGFGREYPRNGIRRGGFGGEYPGNGNRRGGLGRGRRYTWSQISDRMNSTEIVQVWVKKEDKLDA